MSLGAQCGEAAICSWVHNVARLLYVVGCTMWRGCYM